VCGKNKDSSFLPKIALFLPTKNNEGEKSHLKKTDLS
jgi:hypothetical protein